ncbi:unnamed protein product [Calicophoron daubneyi]|uniref:Uncharacterized protein n=1 Tax=Calicophoron daubneyi TaxID=300641 RepID=A0AAV2TL19_CALDB
MLPGQLPCMIRAKIIPLCIIVYLEKFGLTFPECSPRLCPPSPILPVNRAAMSIFRVGLLSQTLCTATSFVSFVFRWCRSVFPPPSLYRSIFVTCSLLLAAPYFCVCF